MFWLQKVRKEQTIHSGGKWLQSLRLVDVVTWEKKIDLTWASKRCDLGCLNHCFCYFYYCCCWRRKKKEPLNIYKAYFFIKHFYLIQTSFLNQWEFISYLRTPVPKTLNILSKGSREAASPKVSQLFLISYFFWPLNYQICKLFEVNFFYYYWFIWTVVLMLKKILLVIKKNVFHGVLFSLLRTVNLPW